jgi:hypothetical protein
MNKARSHLHIFKKIKLTHCYFKSLPSICRSWIDRVDFLHFLASRIHVRLSGVVSSLFSLWCRLSSSRRRHTTALYHTFFPWSQDELDVFASSSDNASSSRLPSRVKTEALNSHHRHRPPSPDRSTPTLHYYKNIISTLATLSTTQPCRYSAFSLSRAPRHRSFTRCRRSLSPLSYVHHPSAQWHSRWWTSRPFFTFRIAYWHMNSHKIYFYDPL